MPPLTSKKRNALPGSSFALPGRRYPINDRAHAANAKARVSQYGTPAEKAKVNAAVSRKYPGMGKSNMGNSAPSTPSVSQRAAMRKGKGECAVCGGSCSPHAGQYAGERPGR